MNELSQGVNFQDFQQGREAEADKALLVKFFIKAKQDQAETLKEGRPIFRDIEYIDIKIPGDRSNAICRPASEGDKQRFPEHYSAFKNRTEHEMETGSSLHEWPLMSRSMAEELAFFHVKTVEQLATMSDTQCGKFMGMYVFREKAKRWVKQAEADKPLWEMDTRMANLEKENEELRGSLRELVRSIELDTDDTPAEKKRKHKRAAKKLEAPEPQVE